MKFLLKMAAITVLVALSACAQRTYKIQAADVPAAQYGDLSCRQIRSEMIRVAQKLHETGAIQDHTAISDAAVVGATALVAHPAIFFMSTSDEKAQVAEWKGDYNALQKEASIKKCPGAAPLPGAQATANAAATPPPQDDGAPVPTVASAPIPPPTPAGVAAAAALKAQQAPGKPPLLTTQPYQH